MSDSSTSPRVAAAKEKCPLHGDPQLPYLAWHEDAERRSTRGERQRRCPTCKLWIWPEFFKEAIRGQH